MDAPLVLLGPLAEYGPRSRRISSVSAKMWWLTGFGGEPSRPVCACTAMAGGRQRRRKRLIVLNDDVEEKNVEPPYLLKMTPDGWDIYL